MPTGADIVAYAHEQLGAPYHWGAEGPHEFDCSGLVQYVYKHFGLSTPRTTSSMMANNSPLQPVNRAQLQAGDLVFSHWEGEPPHSHVAIYTGNNSVIEAPQPGQTVTTTPYGSAYQAHTDAYRRVPGLAGAGPPAKGGSTIDAIKTGLQNVPGLGGLGLIPTPSNVTDALTNIGNAMAGVAGSVAGVGELATVVTRALLPSNMLRGAMLLFGSALVLIGIWFLAREVKESNV